MYLEFTSDDLTEIGTEVSKILVQGDRIPDVASKMTGRQFGIHASSPCFAAVESSGTDYGELTERLIVEFWGKEWSDAG